MNIEDSRRGSGNRTKSGTGRSLRRQARRHSHSLSSTDFFVGPGAIAVAAGTETLAEEESEVKGVVDEMSLVEKDEERSMVRQRTLRRMSQGVKKVERRPEMMSDVVGVLGCLSLTLSADEQSR